MKASYEIFGAFILISLLMISSCHKSGSTGNLVLKFNPLFGGVPLTLNKVYESPDGNYFNFQNYKFYLSHIKLVRNNGSSVEVNPLVYVSLYDSVSMNIAATCPVGSYTGIQFNIGLDSIQNSQPISGDPTSPYYENNGTTWGLIAPGYVFVQVDGLGTNSNPPENNITYHVGTNPYYTNAPVLSKNFPINGGSQTTLNLTADILNIFYGNSKSINTINILTNNYTETVNDTTALPRTFINDFAQIFSIE